MIKYIFLTLYCCLLQNDLALKVKKIWNEMNMHGVIHDFNLLFFSLSDKALIRIFGRWSDTLSRKLPAKNGLPAVLRKMLSINVGLLLPSALVGSVKQGCKKSEFIVFRTNLHMALVHV